MRGIKSCSGMMEDDCKKNVGPDPSLLRLKKLEPFPLILRLKILSVSSDGVQKRPNSNPTVSPGSTNTGELNS